ncbi:MAG: N-acetyl-gamma-glutamyl-phosphate reductase [Actinomycetota bacterium]|nr:N-acetyl-gamma-glutamyl-phosphate reductase [Actinomycetota bacterium]
MPSAVVAGASGYAGALAARLLHAHPDFELVAVTSRSDAGVRLDELYPYHRVPLTLDAFDVDELGDVDAAVVAYPHGASAPTVEQLHERGVRVVDLSADFRLRDPGTYAEWYGEHGAPSLFGHAVYGLPERYREQIREAHIVANPGCFPTAAVLALAPIADLIADVVIDAKTGVSGAGRAATAKTHFVTVDENVTPYGVARHRHTPEIEQELGAAGAEATVQFTPHLLPIDQGELVSCYVTPRERVDGDAVQERFARAYESEPFVELSSTPPGVRAVRDTNYCRLFATVDERTGKVLVFAAIDNLWKGAASQAVQNLNLMFGLDETAGLAA